MPFRYDLNQITYDYTVEVMNRFKGLDLVDRVPEELWMKVRILQEVMTQIANICWIIEKQHERSRKTSISALLAMPKPLTVWITTNYGKF